MEHHAPGVYSEHHDDTVKNISSYDDDAEFAFKQREKNKTDAGQF